MNGARTQRQVSITERNANNKISVGEAARVRQGERTCIWAAIEMALFLLRAPRKEDYRLG